MISLGVTRWRSARFPPRWVPSRLAATPNDWLSLISSTSSLPSVLSHAAGRRFFFGAQNELVLQVGNKNPGQVFAIDFVQLAQVLNAHRRYDSVLSGLGKSNVQRFQPGQARQFVQNEHQANIGGRLHRHGFGKGQLQPGTDERLGDMVLRGRGHQKQAGIVIAPDKFTNGK